MMQLQQDMKRYVVLKPYSYEIEIQNKLQN
jgi:hypothetical protein